MEKVLADSPLISIVCVSLDNPTYLDLMLRGLQKNTVNTFEVLVHGNMAGEEFDAVVEKYKDIISVYTKSDKNLSIAAPANTLFKCAKGKYFQFLDDDTYFAPGWDEALLAKVKPDMMFQLLYPTVTARPGVHHLNKYNFDHNEYNYGETPETFKEDEFNQTWKENRIVLKDTPYYPTGNFFIKKRLWEIVGGYNEDILFGEDGVFIVDVYKKAEQEQQPIEYRIVADSGIYHFGFVGASKPAAQARPQKDGNWIRENLRDVWHKVISLKLKD